MLDYHYPNINHPQSGDKAGVICPIIFELPLPVYSTDGSGWRTTVLWGDSSTKWLWGDLITNYSFTIEYRRNAGDSWHQAYDQNDDPILDYTLNQYDNNYGTIFLSLSDITPSDEIQIRIRNKRIDGDWAEEYGPWVESDEFGISEKVYINPMFITSGQYPTWISNAAPKFPFTKKINRSKVNAIKFIDGGLSSYKMRADITEYKLKYNMTDTKLTALRQFLGQDSIKWYENSFQLIHYQDGDFVNSEVKYVSNSLSHNQIGVNTLGDKIHDVRISLREVI